jgi:hypothetical protein
MNDPQTMHEALFVIQKFFEDKNIDFYEKKKLWDVLTALRGPDDGNDYSKNATTGVVRYYALGPILNEDPIGAVVNKDRASFVIDRSSFSGTSHFSDHIRKAFSVLELDWTRLNIKEMWKP